MKRIISLVLTIFVFCFSLMGCSNSDTNMTENDVFTGISREEALEIGKQKTVDHFCLEENVSKLRMIYGTEDVTREDDGGWKVHLLGYYYPVDAYGAIGDKTRFAFTVHMDKTGDVSSTFEY